MTKCISKDEIEQMMDFMQHVFMEGRHKDAPEPSVVNDSAIPNQQEHEAIRAHLCARRAHSTVMMKNTSRGACLNVSPFPARSQRQEDEVTGKTYNDLYMN